MIGTNENKKHYINEKISKWKDEINLLAEIAKTYPHSASSAYVTSYQHKMTCFLRNIPGIAEEMRQVDEVVRHRLIPAIIGGHIINDDERRMLSLPPRLGGLGLKVLEEEAEIYFRDSMGITSSLQNQILGSNDDSQPKTRNQLRKERDQREQEKLQRFMATSDDATKRKMEILNQKGVSNWLTVMPIKDEGLSC